LEKLKMAKKTKKSGLAGKVGAAGDKAVSKHKGDDTSFSGGSGLPEGINDGVAKLTKCYFSTYAKGENKGEYFFRASGVVVSPDEVNGTKVVGRTTSIMEPIYDTAGRSRESTEEHIAWIMNELRKLGVDTEELEDVNDLENVAAVLQEAGPHFKFRTWKGEATEQYPDPRVNEIWEGECGYEASDEDDVEDDSEETEESGEDEEEEVEEEVEEKPTKKSKKSKAKEQTLEELGTLADDDDDTDAQEKLLDLAKKAGVEESDVDETSSWAEVVALIEGAGDVGEAEEEEEEEEVEEEVPEKGDVYKFKPKGKQKTVDIEVTAVFGGKKTCNV
jgi:hypothetical protein